MKRVLAFLILPLPIALGGCSVAAAEASPAKAPTMAEQCSSIEADVSPFRVADHLTDEILDCGTFRLGEGMSALHNTTINYDESCLSEHGYRVGENQQLMTTRSDATSQQDAYSCARLALTSDECRQIGDGLTRGSQVYRERDSAALTALGCSSKTGAPSTALALDN